MRLSGFGVMFVCGAMLAIGQVTARVVGVLGSGTPVVPDRAAQLEIANGPSVPMPAPTLPYLDWKACPFEGCAYKNWTALRQVVVYDTWEAKRRPVGQLEKGQVVKAVTGVVVTTRPGVIRIDSDLPEHDLKAGDKVLTYSSLGEGFAKAWWKDRFYSEFDLGYARGIKGQGCSESYCSATSIDPGDKSWWVQLTLTSGRTVWAAVDPLEGDFGGITVWDAN